MIVPMKLMLHWRGLEMHFRCVEKLKFSYQKQSGGWLIILPYCVLTPTTKKSALADSVS